MNHRLLRMGNCWKRLRCGAFDARRRSARASTGQMGWYRARLMQTALLILPNFVLIVIGLVLARRFDFGRDFWDGLEKLGYYVLFPALLDCSRCAGGAVLGPRQTVDDRVCRTDGVVGWRPRGSLREFGRWARGCASGHAWPPSEPTCGGSR